MSSKDKIRELVDAFVGDLDRLIRETVWETAKESLGMAAPAAKVAPRATAAAAPAAPAAAKTAARAAKGSGKKRNPAEIDKLTAQLLAAIVAKPGLRMEQLRKQLGASKAEILTPVTRLIEGKKVRRTGQKRATQYYPAK